MKHCYALFLLISVLRPPALAQRFNRQADSVLKLMTPDEKIGQMNQLSGKEEVTGPLNGGGNTLQDIKTGKVGSLLNVRGAARTRELQQMAMQSRLHIPLIFGLDIIHGYRTTFPVPLALSCSWDAGLIERVAAASAAEGSAGGLHWTFAPALDVTRDPRWGRVMEASGEDTYLTSALGAAWVRGFQGSGLGTASTLMSCAKAFVAYGAVIGGRDYNSADMSEHTLWQFYLPPFKAALDAGAGTFMNSLNELNGVPATGSVYLQRRILKGEWAFKGFTVSDWGAVREMVAHGYARDIADASVKAVNAGSDMDMEGHCFSKTLASAIKRHKISMSLIDDAVRRILVKKFELGLFADPYRYCHTEAEKRMLNDTIYRKLTSEAAQKSLVLLKNEHNLLPIGSQVRHIAVIGPLADAPGEMSGAWNVRWPDERAVSILKGLQRRCGTAAELVYTPGCGISDTSRAGFAAALAAAGGADVVIVCIGESKAMSGEAKSRTEIGLPGVQEELIKTIQGAGKPIVAVISAGRPLIFPWISKQVPAILYTWWLGDEAGSAIANILFGDINPSGKLTMTFPASVGQIPLYYNHNNTGRPASQGNTAYRSGYIDNDSQPAYAFGHGLSYTKYSYERLTLSDTVLKDRPVNLSFRLTNTGKRAGVEIVQLYIRHRVASVIQPVKSLSGFQKIALQPGESREVKFIVNIKMAAILNQSLHQVVEPGDMELMIGASSKDIRLRTIIHIYQ